MRCRLLAVALLMPTCARAVDWSPFNQRFLSDPAYLPLAGHLTTDLSYSYTAETSDVLQANPNGRYVPLGAETEHHDRQANNFGGALHYGITDNISVGISLNTGNQRDQGAYLKTVFLSPTCPQSAGGRASSASCGRPFQNITQTQDFRFIGLSNPNFKLSWRAISEAWAPVDVDFAANYSPALLGTRGATPNSAGTLAGGSQHVGVTTNISRETRLVTVAVFGTVGYTDKQAVGEKNGAQITSGHFNYTVGLESQTRLTPRFSLNLGSSAGWSYRFSTRQDGVLARTLRPGTNFAPYAALVVRVIPTRLNAVLRYEHDIYGDRITSNLAGPQTRGTNDAANSFTASLSYRF